MAAEILVSGKKKLRIQKYPGKRGPKGPKVKAQKFHTDDVRARSG